MVNVLEQSIKFLTNNKNEIIKFSLLPASSGNPWYFGPFVSKKTCSICIDVVSHLVLKSFALGNLIEKSYNI